MSIGRKTESLKAAGLLVAATFFWAASFPVMKALGLRQEALAPGVNTLFLSAVSVVARFGLSALVLAVWFWERARPRVSCSAPSPNTRITRLEMWQGAGLGFFSGLGILCQMDGVMHIAASTSAFLTQCYCIFIPVIVARRRREWPSGVLVSSCLMVMAGVAVLADVRVSNLRLNRGEAETILASLIFTGQILWLERPVFAANRATPVTLVMFAFVALLILPVAVTTADGRGEWREVYSSSPAIVLTIFLSLVCTLTPYTLMNFWQQKLPAAHASLIYAAEPLITSVFALFLPAWLSSFAAVNYANEVIGWHLLIGGGLVIAANLLVLMRP
jgi:drug/metabolite transporter (DMT)-like permease